jgi:hypothetical protein
LVAQALERDQVKCTQSSYDGAQGSDEKGDEYRASVADDSADVRVEEKEGHRERDENLIHQLVCKTLSKEVNELDGYYWEDDNKRVTRDVPRVIGVPLLTNCRVEWNDADICHA